MKNINLNKIFFYITLNNSKSTYYYKKKLMTIMLKLLSENSIENIEFAINCKISQVEIKISRIIWETRHWRIERFY